MLASVDAKSNRHPLYGGDKRNPAVTAFFSALPRSNIACLRFDFRGVGDSSGEFDNGNGEKLDLIAGIEFLKEQYPGVPIIVGGYSFGSVVALDTAHPDIAARIGVAPPLKEGGKLVASGEAKPTLLLPPENDQYCPANKVNQIAKDWVGTKVVEVNGTDHFLGSRTAWIADRGVEWLNGVLKA